MIKTSYGVFNGNSWDEICQKCFKMKYESDGYQEMEASPGDFGIEGFTRTGTAFQCYCPDQEYTKIELYENIRDKITIDLKKLRTYQQQLKSRLPGIKIKMWQFVTPLPVDNKILAHIGKKIDEVKSWNLEIIDSNFDIQIKDIDFLAKEISMILSIENKKISFHKNIPNDIGINWDEKDNLQENINKKNTIRIGKETPNKIIDLNTITFEQLVNGDTRLKNIMYSLPDLYYKLSILFTEYELSVKEKTITWSGTPEELIGHLKDDLENLLKEDFPLLTCADRRSLIDYLVSKWIALCPLNFSE